VICGAFSLEWSLLKDCARWTSGMRHDPDMDDRIWSLNGLTASPSIKDVFQHSISCKATDPRDKIYGMLGLFDHLLTPVDYSLTAPEAFRKFMQVLITETSSIQALHWFGAHGRRNDLCSWVPDFSISNLIGRFPDAFSGPSSVSVEFPRTVLPGVNFFGTDIILKGVQIDTIDEVGEEMPSGAGFAIGETAFQQMLRSWELLAVNCKDRKRTQSISRTFLNALVGHYPGTNRGDLGGVPDWYDRYGTNELRNADPEYFRDADDHKTILMWLFHQPDKYDAQMYRDRELHDFSKALAETCYGRRFYTTTDGLMGLAAPQAQKGDLVVFFAGGWYPFTLRTQNYGGFLIVGDCTIHDVNYIELFPPVWRPAFRDWGESGQEYIDRVGLDIADQSVVRDFLIH